MGGGRILLRLLSELFFQEVHELHGLGGEWGEVIVVVGHFRRRSVGLCDGDSSDMRGKDVLDHPKTRLASAR